MADESSKLKAQITFLTNLIKSHKQTAHEANVDRKHGSSAQVDHNNRQSFSWQRRKQQQAEKQPVAGTSSSLVKNQVVKAKSSYILDKRTVAGKVSGQLNNTKTSLNVAAIPGSSVLYPVVTMNNTSPLVSNVRTTTNQSSSLSSSKSTVSSKTTALSSNVVPPAGSCDVKFSLQLSSTFSAKNPYVLNKKQKESVSVSNMKTVPPKTELKWSKPVAEISSRITDDSRSHSDSELYTRKSSVFSTRQPASAFVRKGKLPVLMHQKAPSTSNLQSSFKWSKPLATASNNISEKTSAMKTKISRSKLKWTKPGIDAQPGNRRPENSYLLKKGNSASRNSTKKQGLAFSKTVSRHKLTKKPVYSMPDQSSLVWRAPGTLKLDRQTGRSPLKYMNQKPSSRQSSGGFIERRQRAVLKDNLVVTRYSVVRSKRKQDPIKAQKLNKVVVIEGVPYKTSSNKLRKTKSPSARKENVGKVTSLSKTRKTGKLSKTVTIQGAKFAMDPKGKKLQRVDTVPLQAVFNKASSSKQSQGLAGRRRLSSRRKIILRTPTTLIRSKVSNSQNKTLARCVLKRSINNARLYKKNKGKPPSEQYCMFYNRFGKCNRQDTCPYIHDPSKVAVCTKFLRGRCKNTDGSCPFSHKVDRDKMPVCQFFLRGKCSNDNCPYSHVNVSKKAEVCEDFLKGFCSRGQQCTKKHTLECEEFSQTGKCSKGSKCKLMHRTRKPVSRKRKSSLKEEKDGSKLSKLDFTNDEGFLPLKASTSDSDLTSAQEPVESTPEEAKEKAEEPLVIRPRFLKPKEPAK